ncbi:hypothetical protein Tco_0142568 [Tanacetum coccineum]
MLVQPAEDEDATSERSSEPQPTPSPPHPSEANVEPQSDPSPRPSLTTHIPDSIPEVFEETQDAKGVYYMDIENAQDVGRTRNVVYEEKENAEDGVSTEDAVSTEYVVSTDKEKISTDRSRVSTDKEKVSTDRSRVSTDKEEVSTDRPDKGTDDQNEGRSVTQTAPTTTTPTIFGDDETIAQVLIIMSQNKEKLKGED